MGRERCCENEADAERVLRDRVERLGRLNSLASFEDFIEYKHIAMKPRLPQRLIIQQGVKP